jgi:hypothetical protein
MLVNPMDGTQKPDGWQNEKPEDVGIDRFYGLPDIPISGY